MAVLNMLHTISIILNVFCQFRTQSFSPETWIKCNLIKFIVKTETPSNFFPSINTIPVGRKSAVRVELINS